MRRVTFEWTDDNGVVWDIVYSVPDDSPKDMTEGEAENLSPVAPTHHRRG